MKWKMFGLAGRFGSTKEGVSKVFGLIRAIGMRDLNASLDAKEDLRQPNGFNLQAYLTAKKRMQEIDAQKAMILHELRHGSWKAGGPV